MYKVKIKLLSPQGEETTHESLCAAADHIQAETGKKVFPYELSACIKPIRSSVKGFKVEQINDKEKE